MHTEINLSNLRDQWPGLSREGQARVVFAMQAAGLTQSQIAEMTGESPRRIKTRKADADSMRLAGTLESDELLIQIDRDETIEIEMDRRDRLQTNRRSRNEITNLYIARGVMDEVKALIAAPSHDVEHAIRRHKAQIQDELHTYIVGRTEAMIQHVSDLHHCRFIPGVMDEDTTRQALFSYGEKCAEKLARRRLTAQVDTLYLLLNGDNLHGLANYKAQSREVTGSSSQQIARTAWLFIDYINVQRTLFKNVVVVVTGGNHGKKAHNDDLLTENAEFEVGQIIKARYAECEDVEVQVSQDNFWQVIHVLGRRFFVTHGDKIAGAGNPQTISDAVRRWDMTSTIPPFDDAILGHFHRCLSLPLPGRDDSPEPRTIYVGGTASFEDKFLEGFGSVPNLVYWTLFTDGKEVDAHKVALYT